MRVLEINPYLTASRGGVERRLFGLSRELARRGHEVTAVTCASAGGMGGGAPEGAPQRGPRGSQGGAGGTWERHGGLGAERAAEEAAGPAMEETVEHGVAVRRLAPRLFEAGPYDPPFLSAEGLARGVEGLAPDVVDIHYMWTPDYTRSLRKRLKGTPIVYTLHNSFGFGEGIEGRAAYISGSVFKLFLRNCDLAVCVSDFVRRDVEGQGIKGDKLRVVASGVDRTSDVELAALRGAPRGHPRPYAVFAGRLERTKGLSVLVEALGEARGPLSLVVLGQGPDLEGLQDEARDFGLGDRVSFEGFVSEGRKRQLLAQADLFVYPATFEPFGLALLEAMDLGCPVLSTSVGGVPEVVGDAGALVAPGDAEALGKALADLEGDRDARTRLGEAGRARAERFSWSAAAAGMEAAFKAAGAKAA